MTDAPWKEEMFMALCEPFIEVLASKSLVQGFNDFLVAVTSDLPRRDLAVDLGCGIGRTAAALATQFSSVIAVDYSAPLLAEAGRQLLGLTNVELDCADFRKLGAVLGDRLADLYLRAYTSLGYFSRSEEKDLLAKFWKLSSGPGAIYIGDTFDFEWVARKKTIKRTSYLGSFIFHERYQADLRDRKIVAEWTYEYADHQQTIPFLLDGYTSNDIEMLIEGTGWELVHMFSDFRLDARREKNSASERIIYVLRHCRCGG